jgi:hypothetical protein
MLLATIPPCAPQLLSSPYCAYCDTIEVEYGGRATVLAGGLTQARANAVAVEVTKTCLPSAAKLLGFHCSMGKSSITRVFQRDDLARHKLVSYP